MFATTRVIDNIFIKSFEWAIRHIESLDHNDFSPSNLCSR